MFRIILLSWFFTGCTLFAMNFEEQGGCYGFPQFDGDFDMLDSVACSTLPKNRPKPPFDADESISSETSPYSKVNSDELDYYKLHIRSNKSLEHRKCFGEIGDCDIKLKTRHQARPGPNLSGSHANLDLSGKVSSPNRKRYSLGSLSFKNGPDERFLKTNKPTKKNTDSRELQYTFEKSETLTLRDIEKIKKELVELGKKYKELILRLSNCRINDQGALKIAEILKANINITRLELSFNNIGFQGASNIIIAAKENTHLKHIDLQWNKNIEESTMQALKVLNNDFRIDLFLDNTPPYLRDNVPGKFSCR